MSNFECEHCGAEVSPNAKGCHACGATRQGGEWRHLETYDGIDLPDDEFNYEEFLEKEFGSTHAQDRRKLFWRIVAGVLLIAFILLVLGC